MSKKKKADKPKPKKLTQYQEALLSEKKKKFDPTATAKDCIEDLRKIQESHPEKGITRNFYRAKGKYSDSTWNAHFGTFLEFRRQAGLEYRRQTHKLERDIAKQASVDHYQEFFHSEVLPYHMKYEKDIKGDMVTIMVFSDLHDLEVDRFALSVFIDQCKIVQPDIIIANGDIYDLYEFSRYTKDPRQCKPVERLKFVLDHVWKPLREVCPNAQIDLIIGNHEYRLLRLMADVNPNLQVVLSDFVGLKLKDLFGLDKYQINLQSKLDLTCYTNKDINDVLNQNYKIYGGCFVATHKPSEKFKMSGTNGHLHKGHFKSWSEMSVGGKLLQCSWVQTPALHKIDAGYIEGISQANMGFSIVHISQSTHEVIQQLHHIQPTFAHINGKFYRKK